MTTKTAPTFFNFNRELPLYVDRDSVIVRVIRGPRGLYVTAKHKFGHLCSCTVDGSAAEAVEEFKRRFPDFVAEAERGLMRFEAVRRSRFVVS